MGKFQELTAQLEQALTGISHENLDISDEVKEQVSVFFFFFAFYADLIFNDQRHYFLESILKLITRKCRNVILFIKIISLHF